MSPATPAGHSLLFTDDEIEQARALTPGCAAEPPSSASQPRRVLPAAARRCSTRRCTYLRREALEGGYEVGGRTADLDDAVYDSIARLIGASPSEIARFEHATAAWNAAFWSLPMEEGQRILVHDHEYGANAVAFMRAAETKGVIIERVPSDESGQVSVDAMADALAGGDVALVSLTHVPTNGGLVNPAVEIGALTRAAGVPYLVDACQSVGQLDIDVDEIGCDFLSATGRKYLRGPRGHGIPVRAATRSSTGRSRRSPITTGPTWWPSIGTNCCPTRAGSSAGSTTMPPGSVWARPSTMRLRGGSIGSRRR